MNIADVVNATPKTAWVEFNKNISLELSYLSRSKLKVLTDQSTTLVYDPRSKVHQPKVDNKKMTRLFLQETVKSWKGVTLRALFDLLPIDPAKVPEGELDKEIEFSVDQLEVLVENNSEFDSFIYNAAIDVKCFNTSVMSVGPALAAKN